MQENFVANIQGLRRRETAWTHPQAAFFFLKGKNESLCGLLIVLRIQNFQKIKSEIKVLYSA
jgi:hypothetical protein